MEALEHAPQTHYPQERLIHQLFEAQVERTPTAEAVVFEDKSLTYAALNRRANQLALYLNALGVGPDQRVGICMERSLEMVVGLLAILKAGGAYVPVDPGYPIERLQYMVADASPGVLLTQQHLLGRLPDTTAKVIPLDRHWREISPYAGYNIDPASLGLRNRHLAYVIYTSGSTGRPKGAMNEHRGVVNRLQWMQDEYKLGPDDRVLQKTPFSFDVSVWEFFWTLMTGARLVVARPEGHKDPTYLRSLIRTNAVTRLHFVPSMLQAFLEHFSPGDCPSLRQIVCSGEELTATLQEKCFACLPEIKLSNLYGPTEAAVDVTFWECNAEDSSIRVPIGRPIANIRMYVLDEHANPVPSGAVGEIYIAGIGVGRGYLNRPELTAERFICDPFSTDREARMYRTGDLGRWRPDGSLEYLGRNDHQVKIRGFRIELGEIEAQLTRHPQIKEALVMAREAEKQLVAYVVPRRSYFESHAWRQEDGPTPEPLSQYPTHEFHDVTLERLRALRPKRALEVGYATGSLLKPLALECELLHCAMAGLPDQESGTFDTLIFNSVVQHCFDLENLLSVLRAAVRLLRPNGRIFVGNILHLGLLRALHSVTQLNKAPDTINIGQLRKRIARAMAEERHLAIHPRFFELLPGHIPDISAVEVQLRRSRAPGDLARYHYDAVLHTGRDCVRQANCERLDWSTLIDSSAEFERGLVQRRWRALCLSAIPNSSLQKEVAAQRLIETSDERLEVGALRTQLNDRRSVGLDPEQFWRWGQAFDYNVQVSWRGDNDHGEFDIQLLDRTRIDQIQWSQPPAVTTMQPLGAFINSPLNTNLQRHLVPQLREHLSKTLPEYMIPSRWMLLSQVPLSQNGKADRGALPIPEAPVDAGVYIAPRTQVERVLVDIWKQVLGVDHLGTQDNFLDLGGHSLHAMKLIAKTAQQLAVELSVADVLQGPTVEKMAQLIEASQSDSEAPGNSNTEEYEEGVI
jgi:amino acid adenylation domain-containing protein